MGTDDPVERALLQGLIKLAAAYVHDVRGNPAGIVRNLEGARALLAEAAPRSGPDPRTNAAGSTRRPDRRDRPPAGRPGRPSRRTDRWVPRVLAVARGDSVTMPAPIPTVDVAEAERRLREDPAGPILLDVREPNEFARSGRRARCSCRRRRSWRASAELPADRPLLVVCTSAGGRPP